tara:strand:+ start:1633 stop:3279 length:1647 start_codon:yes stop_codon:yes gene_type:complete
VELSNLGLLLLLVLGLVGVDGIPVQVVNGDFETPIISAVEDWLEVNPGATWGGWLQLDPSGDGFGGAVHSSSGSMFQMPLGSTQAYHISAECDKGHLGGISQNISGFQAGDAYTLSFQASGGDLSNNADVVEVRMDGTTVWAHQQFTTSSIIQSNSHYSEWGTFNVSFVVPVGESGMANLSFTTPVSGASCIQIDNVVLSAATPDAVCGATGKQWLLAADNQNCDVACNTAGGSCASQLPAGANTPECVQGLASSVGRTCGTTSVVSGARETSRPAISTSGDCQHPMLASAFICAGASGGFKRLCPCEGVPLSPLAPPSPPPPPGMPTIVMDFETDSTSGLTTDGGPFPWTWRSGSTCSSSTGPSSGFGGSGSYYYAETSTTQPCNGVQHSSATTGSLYNLTYDGSGCVGGYVHSLTFYYHMYGSTMGELELVDAAGSRLWSRTGDQPGDQGNTWHQATATVDSTSFAFEYRRGSNYYGDAALDEMVVTCGSAPPTPPDMPPMAPLPPFPPPSPPPLLGMQLFEFDEGSSFLIYTTNGAWQTLTKPAP